jgi:hypothetical protein
MTSESLDDCFVKYQKKEIFKNNNHKLRSSEDLECFLCDGTKQYQEAIQCKRYIPIDKHLRHLEIYLNLDL